MTDQENNQELYDEAQDGTGTLRPAWESLGKWLTDQTLNLLQVKHKEADSIFERLGITFAVYGERAGSERLIPFDIVPRIISADEWDLLKRGLIQRVSALNMFLYDVYHEQNIINAGIVPKAFVLSHSAYEPFMVGFDVPGNIYTHIAGIDIVRAGQGEFYVLEDNLRCPSGVSYMLQNRRIMMRLFPELFSNHSVAPIDHYPELLAETLAAVAPVGASNPTAVLLTPGFYNSAYFEHAFLAQSMGLELVEGGDLFVRDNRVYMSTIHGPRRVHVIYRRIDDDFLDPLCFRPDSALGVPGLVNAYRSGHVTIANAIGTGIADDKAIYTYVPDIIRFYLDEEPILNNVPTWRMDQPDDMAYAMERLEELVVKRVDGSGGYGMLIGPAATSEEIAEFRDKIKTDPAGYIAQPTLALSTCPTLVKQGIAPRHVDLRPFVLSGKTIDVVPGGLTRVAMKEGSLVVNSSQGGGTKDTWVLEREGD